MIKLISYTKSANDIRDLIGDDLTDLVAYCARVSNPQNQNNTKTAKNLVKYLVEHSHWSPLEMASVCLEIETTRDISRQIIRHRSFSFQEFSQRYANVDLLDESFILREARLQDTKNRQSSIDLNSNNEKEQQLIKSWEQQQRRIMELSKEVYDWAISAGIAKEQARAVLPEGLTKTRLYMNGSLRSWLHYITLRTGIETQKEHREIAQGCAKEISNIFSFIEKGGEV